MRAVRKLVRRAGGPALLIAIALGAGIALVWLAAPRGERGAVGPGNGRDLEPYGFDLSTCLMPRSALAASGVPKDGIPALTAPRVVPGSVATGLRMGRRGPYLVSDDRVIGIEIAGEARAYPLHVLNWHEIVNDAIGGVPIAITFSPLSYGIAVFDRRVGGETLEFGASGLLFQSNLLLYERRRGGGIESLWSQLQARAVAGPAAALGRALEPLPCSLARWDLWLRAFPHTTVLVPPDLSDRRYRRDPYKTYFSGSRLVAPVDPYPPPPPLAPKSVLAIFETAEGRRVVPLESRVDPGIPGVLLDVSGEPASVLLEEGARVPSFYAFWFAWHATHPETSGPERTPGSGIEGR